MTPLTSMALLCLSIYCSEGSRESKRSGNLSRLRGFSVYLSPVIIWIFSYNGTDGLTTTPRYKWLHTMLARHSDELQLCLGSRRYIFSEDGFGSVSLMKLVPLSLSYMHRVLVTRDRAISTVLPVHLGLLIVTSVPASGLWLSHSRW